MDDDGKTLPYNEDAEKAYVSNILQHEACLDDAIEAGSAQWIFSEACRSVAEACFELRNENEPVDVTTVGARLLEKGDLEKHGPGMLLDVHGYSSTFAHQEHYGKLVRGDWVKRLCINTLSAGVEQAHDESIQGDALINEIETSVLAIRDECDSKDGTLIDGKDAIMKALSNIEAAQARGGGLAGHPTGMAGLDALTSGFQPGNLILIPARPSQGKTALLVSLMSDLMDINIPCAMFTLEMETREIMRRFICMRTGIEYRKLLEGGLSDTNLKDIMRAAGDIASSPFVIDDTPALGLNQFRSRCRRLARKGIKVVGVDYIQLMRHFTKRAQQNRQVEIADISAGVKATLKECGLTGIILAQLNRDVEQGKPRKPRMSDIRESGALEQDSDIIACIHRPNKDSEEYENENIEPCTLCVIKNRNGPTGEIPMVFGKSNMRFRERASV